MNNKKKTGCLIAGGAGLIFLFIVGSLGSRLSENQLKATPPPVPQLKATPPPAHSVESSVPPELESLPPVSIDEEQAESLFKEAQSLAGRGDADAKNQIYVLAITVYKNAISSAEEAKGKTESSKLLKKLDRFIATTEKKRDRVQFKHEKQARQFYAEGLRGKYLDKGMDIEVTTAGNRSQVLKLKYSLFNAVWVHKYSKGAMVREWRGLGFEEVKIANGFTKMWTLTLVK